VHVLSSSEERGAAAGRPTLLQVTDLSRRFGSIQALDRVSLDVAAGEVHGLCGHNGAGKSTLVKSLTGLVRPDSGSMALAGAACEWSGPRDAQGAGIALVDQELSIIPELTVAENLFLGDVRSPFVSRRRARRAVASRLLEGVGLGDVPPDRPAGDLSVGERQLLEIARALHREAKLLILDEPTATLSKPEIERVFEAVAEVAAQGRAVIFISHRLDEVLSICDRVTVMRDGAVVGTHGVAELDRARLITLILGEQGRAELPGLRREAGPRDVVATIRGLVPRPAGQPVDLVVRSSEVIGLAGQIGSGSEDVLAALGGIEPGSVGDVTVAGSRVVLGSPQKVGRSGVAYVSGDRKGFGLFHERSIAENLVATRLAGLGRTGVISQKTLVEEGRKLAKVVGVDAERVDDRVSDLSGGNQQKVFIGRCLHREGTRLLLLDEPTRGVDIGGRAEIHQLIRDFADEGGAVVFASTELDELFDLADLIVTMFEGRIVSTARREDATPGALLAELTTGEAVAAGGGR
jgi:ABC-type sugar transport system ATPase subunit